MTVGQNDPINELDDAYREYVDLLIAELEDTIGLAYAHGWRSSRYDAGEQSRKRIAEARSALGMAPLEK